MNLIHYKTLEKWFAEADEDGPWHHFRFSQRKRYTQALEMVKKHLHRRNGAILDIGSAYGEFTYNLQTSSLFKQIDCMDIAWQAVKKTSLSFPEGRHFQGDILNIPLKDRAYDTAVCMETLYFVLGADQRKKALGEISRMLKDDGIFLCSSVLKTPERREDYIFKDYQLLDIVKEKFDVLEVVYLNYRILALFEKGISRLLRVSKKAYCLTQSKNKDFPEWYSTLSSSKKRLANCVCGLSKYWLFRRILGIVLIISAKASKNLLVSPLPWFIFCFIPEKLRCKSLRSVILILGRKKREN